MIDLDHPPERRKSGSVKWDALKMLYGREDVLPMWVADMDFPSPPEVQEALIKRVRHGVFGYGLPQEGFFEAAQDWEQRRHGWVIERETLLAASGVIESLRQAVDRLTEPGDGVVIQPPVYPPFRTTVEEAGRRVVENPLRLRNGRYEMDLEDLERKLDDATCLILCNPHNPVGRLWTPTELRSLIDVCRRHGTLVVSDEIHGDLVRGDGTFTPLLSLPESASLPALACFAPSKTFNLPGLQTSAVVIPDPAVRDTFLPLPERAHFKGPNVLGLTAAEAAWRDGGAWLDQVLAYIGENFDTLEARLKTSIPTIRPVRAEATYLAWLDARKLDLDDGALESFLREDARLAVQTGDHFGPEGSGFFRLNLGCTHALLAEALDRLETAVTRRQP